MGVPRIRMDRSARNMGPILDENEGVPRTAPRTAPDRLGSNRASARRWKAGFTGCRLSPSPALQHAYSSRYSKRGEKLLEAHSRLGTLCNLASENFHKSEFLVAAPNLPRFNDPWSSSWLSWGCPGEWIGPPATWARYSMKTKESPGLLPGQLPIGLDLLGRRHGFGKLPLLAPV